MLITTSSSTDTWAKCQALYDFRYNKLLQEKRPGKALLIGSAFHVGCESFWRGEPYGIAWAKVQDSLTNDWWLTDTGKLEMRKLASYLKGYYRRWEDDLREWTVLGVELEWQFEDAEGFAYAGKIDVLARRPDGQLVIIDHKTSGTDETENPGSSWWGKLQMDTQIVLYSYWAETKYGERPEWMHDVVLKSSSQGPRQKKACSRRKGESDLALQMRKAENRETLVEWGARLDETYREGDRYIRRYINMTEDEFDRKLKEIKLLTKEIAKPRKVFIRNTTACLNKFGTCPFFDVCVGFDTTDSDRFESRSSQHTELSIKEMQQ